MMSITPDEAQAVGRRLDLALVIRDGGGTAPAELVVGDKLRDRGHRVTLYGPPEVRGDAEAAGFDLEPLDWPPQPASSDGGGLVPRMIGASEAWAAHLVPRFTDVDVVLADCTAFGAVMAAKASGVPCAAVMPTVYVAGAPHARSDYVRGDWAAALAGINRARSALKLPAVATLTEQILDGDRLLVLASRAFELPEIQPPGHVRYVGPQLPQAHPRTPPSRLSEGEGPLVLVSLSTTDQEQLGLLERLLAAIGQLPVRALVTVGHAVDAARLDPPDNVVVERFVPHQAVLPYTDVVVTHAGHGTVMAAVSAGVPLVCAPMGRDQPAVAARVTRHGLGVRVDAGAGVADLRAAIEQVLRVPAYREAVRRMAEAIEPVNLVVDEVEALAPGRSRMRP